MEVDQLGLDDMDRRVLRAIIEKYNCGPVGLNTIAASVSEESDTIMDVVEPYLLQLGFLERTSQGRMATESACDHLGLTYPDSKPPVFILIMDMTGIGKIILAAGACLIILRRHTTAVWQAQPAVGPPPRGYPDKKQLVHLRVSVRHSLCWPLFC